MISDLQYGIASRRLRSSYWDIFRYPLTWSALAVVVASGSEGEERPVEREDAGQLIGSAPGMYYEKVYSKQLVNVLFIGYLSFDGYSIWERNEENMIRW